MLVSEVVTAFQAHAVRAFPQEACGVAAGGKYLPCQNVANDPLRDFAIDGPELGRITLEHGPIEAVLHSHPYDKRTPQLHPREWPSALDQQSWMAGGIPWGIVATDGEGTTPLYWMDDNNPAPLVGREFRWGVQDCYALIRDWYRMERGVTLMNAPREWGFWERGEELYLQNFSKAGFVTIKPEQVQVGDVCFMRFFNSVSSHAAVVTGPNTILHHLWGERRRSRHDTLSKYRSTITKWVRYAG